MLGYTWVVFEKFSVLFSRDGYLFSTKFLYFFHEMGTFFQETFCIFCAKWVLFCRNFFVCFPKGGCHLRRIFLYFPARWVSFKAPLGDKVSMLTHIYPHKARRKIEVIICKITRLTAHFMCGLMSDLLICTCL